MSENKSNGLIKWMWILAAASVISVFLLLFFLSFQKIPSFKDLENPTDNLATEIYSADGKVLGRYFTENRVPVTYEDISRNITNALIATEDERFFGHSGIDFQALGRVLVRTLILQDASGGGGSTITQQLAKLLYTDQKVGNIVQRALPKLKEWITAVKLEKAYTKEEIISMYLNEFDFLYQAHGVKAAAETYFGKSQDEVDVLEAALIVGMLKNPVIYNPRINPENALVRRNVVLKQMYRNKLLSKEELDSLHSLPINVSNFSKTAHDTGPAPYCRAEVKKMVKEILAQKESRKADGSYYNLEKDGLKIYTTVDSRIQAHAEKAVQKHMSVLQKRFFKHWSWGKTPWNYGEDESFNAVKQLSLTSLVMSSSRFEQLKTKEFDQHLVEVEESFDDMKFTPYTLEILQGEIEGEESVDKLIQENLMTEERAEYVRKVANSKEFAALLPKWKALKKKADDIFNKKVKMKVFDYHAPGFERDTIMSPLDSIKYHRMILQSGVLAIEAGSGHIKAWVGGVNFKHFKQDHVRINRQVGSTFKPFIYATAITIQGVSPCQKVLDVPYTIARGEGRFGLQQDWAPKNSDGEYYNEEVTLYQGLQESINTVSVFLMKQLGAVTPVLDVASAFGIDINKIPAVPAICLGAADLSVEEMTAAYATYANNGIYISPTIISRIEDANGRLVYRASSEEHVALPPVENYVMVDMLKSVAAKSPGVNQLKTENGGKTGTTQNQTDGWYMGITPNLVVGVWVGGEDRWIRFRDLANGQGGRMARPIYVELMKGLEADKTLGFDTKKKFYKPPGELPVTIDCEKYEDLLKSEEQVHPEEIKEEETFFEG